jgi:manganese/iron transport system substrate-binding protein
MLIRRPTPAHPRLRSGLIAVALFLFAVALTACSAGRAGSDRGAKLGVVATTTVLADLVANVGGDLVEVRSLVPKGGEVHTFDPSPSDVAALGDADLVVTNGLGLDAWVSDLVEGADTKAPIVVLAENLPGVDYLEGGEEHDDETEGGVHPGDEPHASDASASREHAGEEFNPHLWLNVEYARKYVDRIAESLAHVDPDHASAYRDRGATYSHELEALDREIAGRMSAIPPENRRIVSFHEAFPYFAAAYGLRIVGVVVGSPGQDPSAGEIAALVQAIRDAGVRAVFAEVQFSDRLARTIAEEAGVKVETRLYNDTLGDPPVDSYIGMMRWNADRIEEAVR